MPDTKVHDSVNRVQEIVVLPAADIHTNRSLHPGDIIDLVDVEEEPIDCAVRDPMDMADPVNGDAIGDAVFDAGLDTDDCIVFDADFWGNNVVCGTDEGEIVGLYDEGGREVLILGDPHSA